MKVKIKQAALEEVMELSQQYVRDLARLTGTQLPESDISRLARAAAYVLPAVRKRRKALPLRPGSDAVAPPRAKGDEPHWIVKLQTEHGPLEIRPRALFRHPSEDLALAEARRLATRSPGSTYTVYARVAEITVQPAEPAPEPAEA